MRLRCFTRLDHRARVCSRLGHTGCGKFTDATSESGSFSGLVALSSFGSNTSEAAGIHGRPPRDASTRTPNTHQPHGLLLVIRRLRRRVQHRRRASDRPRPRIPSVPARAPRGSPRLSPRGPRRRLRDCPRLVPHRHRRHVHQTPHATAHAALPPRQHPALATR